ncbi:MAG TPA: hypothetical protein VMF05_12915 [Stellaceae bacterium]|nr:hypothetical protein [Stellaceae bacterium]
MEPVADHSSAANRAAASPASHPPAAHPPAASLEAPAGTRAKTPARAAAALLAALLVIVIAGILLAPFWAPSVARLLPWGTRNRVVAGNIADLAARVTALEKRPVPDANEIGALGSAQARLARRVDRLEAAANGLSEARAATAAQQRTLSQLTQRLDASDAQTASRAAADTADFAGLRQELAALAATSTGLGDRLTRLEHEVKAQAGSDQSQTMLMLALSQMRAAVAAGRPFAAEYAVFSRLAHTDPKLSAAAQPLAGVAATGVASDTRLERRLIALAARIQAAAPPPASSGWWAQALDRMRGLVTIRRIDAVPTGAAAVVANAQQALARRDLPAAVSALQELNGDDAEAARRWLDLARQRLAAEAALARLQELLAARPAAAPVAVPAPVTVPTPGGPAPGVAPATSPASP